MIKNDSAQYDLFPEKPILVVEDNSAQMDLMVSMLHEAGLTNTQKCLDGRNVFDLLQKYKIELVLLDLGLSHNVRGQDILTKISKEYPNVRVIVITGESDPTMVDVCMKLGAHDYIVKPVNFNRLSTTINRAVEFSNLRTENVDLKHRILRDQLEHPEYFSEIITMDRQMISIFNYIETVAGTSQPILISGESGTGKDLLAKSIHLSSKRRGELVYINADQLTEDLLKSKEVSGSVMPSLLERARGGTLVIQEIGECPLELQLKVLNLFQDRPGLVFSEVRIVATTSQDLSELINAKRFRKDLYYRLQVHTLDVPPLRSRKSDIPLLVSHFLALGQDLYNKSKLPAIEQESFGYLDEHPFDGNVRELEGIIYHALSVERGNRIHAERIRKILGKNRISRHEGTSTGEFILRGARGFPTFKEAETILIQEAMQRSQHKQIHAAKLLGISRQALNKRLKMAQGSK